MKDEEAVLQRRMAVVAWWLGGVRRVLILGGLLLGGSLSGRWGVLGGGLTHNAVH